MQLYFTHSQLATRRIPNYKRLLTSNTFLPKRSRAIVSFLIIAVESIEFRVIIGSRIITATTTDE